MCSEIHQLRRRWDSGVSGGVLVNPSRRNIGVSAFLLVWMVGWSVGGMALVEFLRHPDLLLACWLLIWAVVEGFGVAVLAYLFNGRETITLSPQTLTIRLEALGFKCTWEYEAAAVKGLRQCRQRFLPGRPGRPELLADFACGIAFEYRGKTLGMGRGLNEAEARELVDEMLAAGILADGGAA